MRRLLHVVQPGQLADVHGLEVRDAEIPISLCDADEAVAPEDALPHVLFEALLAEGDVGLDQLGVDVVAVDGTVLDYAEQGLVIGPGHADQAAAWVLPDGFGDEEARGVENAELAEGGLGVKLDNLGVVANDGDWTAERGAGHLVAGQVDVFPSHLVELGLAVVSVVDELPFGGHRYVGHCELTWNWC